jgi:hypothetical protein
MNIRFGNLIAKVILLSAILIAASAASAQAQSLANRARFNIPFDFVFGDKKFPAGQYSVGRALQSSDDLVLSIADRAGRSKAVQLSNAVITLQANTRAVLVFHRYGDQYFLAQVWQAGATVGRQLHVSKKEREIHKQLVANSPANKRVASAKPQTITIAADFQDGNNFACH